MEDEEEEEEDEPEDVDNHGYNKDEELNKLRDILNGKNQPPKVSEVEIPLND